MNPTRSLLLTLLIIVAAFGSAAAQGRSRRLPPAREIPFLEPRNQLENYDSLLETVLIKGRTPVGSVNGRGGAARVEALEIRDTSDGSRATGVVVTLNSTSTNASDQSVEATAMIDYSEIDSLIKGLDTVARADDTVTKLTQFEAHYRSKVDFEIVVFKQTTGGLAVAVEAGYPARARVLMSLDDLAKLRWLILQAKTRLDEAK